MAAAGDDLDLLLSLDNEEGVLETPPGSPSPLPQDDGGGGGPRSTSSAADMSVFRDAVKDYLNSDPAPTDDAAPTGSKKPSKPSWCAEPEVEKYSGLRIKVGDNQMPGLTEYLVTTENPSGYQLDAPSKCEPCLCDLNPTVGNVLDLGMVWCQCELSDFKAEIKRAAQCYKNQLVSAMELNNRFSGIRFVRLSVIRNLLVGDTLSGCWATVGVLMEKGASKLTAAGKNYSVWKMGCLDETNVSVFLFNDAYAKNCNEPVGSVFSLFNSSVRKDGGNGFSLSVYSASNIMKIGVSADYGVCKGKRKDGVACTMVINRRLGAHCKFHSQKATQRFSTTRAELKGGNLRFPFGHQTEGIYMVDPLKNGSKMKKTVQKVLSVDGLKRALSRAEAVTTKSHSQGLRFLSHVTGDAEANVTSKASAKPNQLNKCSEKRPSLATKVASNIVIERKQGNKRMKVQHAPQNTIELEIASSDEEGL